MTIELNLRFVDEKTGKDADGVDGYNFSDFFAKWAVDFAEGARSVQEAKEILRAAYIGPDTENVGVRWSPKQYE
jgi:hypothetical protein